MNKNVVLVFVSATLLFCLVFLASCANWGDPYVTDRKNLAREMGVNLSDYAPLGFPTQYLYEVLKPGLSSDEVHKIVIGYKVVFLCDGDRKGNSELYYYFSTDEDKADRFLIVYDARGKLDYTMGEDSNSRSLQNKVDYCKPGRFGVE
jgi:hypothetical protein